MNSRLALGGVCLLLASSGLFAVSSAPQGVPLVLAAAALVGGAAAIVRRGVNRRSI